MNGEGDTLHAFTILSNLEGATHLRDQIVAASDKLLSSEIHIGSVYNWHPAMYLHKDEALCKRKTKVFTINPKLISTF